jgi:hypothetical protein
MSDVHCGVSDFVDGSKRGDARRDAPASNAGDFVPGLGAFAGRPVGGGTDEECSPIVRPTNGFVSLMG